jgi:hypothetical protein
VGRRGNEFWLFDPDRNIRCPICEGKGRLKSGDLCMYCDGSGRGGFSYNWSAILPHAATVVRSYEDTGVTLRQLYYRLVAAEMLPNTQQAYGSLSAHTAAARRDNGFPSLIDNGRGIDRPNLWASAAEAATWLAEMYMEDRAATQPHNIYVGVEKNGLKAQLFQWFAPLGLPVFACGGYASQSLADEVYEDTRKPGRRGKPNILIYAGDFDADGEDIPRDFADRAGCFDEVVRVALIPEQVEELKLPPQPGKWSSARAKGFADKYADLFESVYGYDLVQIELDAIPPDTLRAIYEEAIEQFFDREEYDAAVEREAEQRKLVEAVAEREE